MGASCYWGWRGFLRRALLRPLGPSGPRGLPFANVSLTPGIYIFNRYEINIFDTASMMNEWNVKPMPGQGSDSYVEKNDLKHRWPKKIWSEKISACMTGVPYSLESKDWAALVGAKGLIKSTDNTMIITAARAAKGVDVTVTLNGTQTFTGNIPSATGGGNGKELDDFIHLQSHHCSGVKFTELTIDPSL